MHVSTGQDGELSVSVVVPVYNGQETLARCAESILPQLLDDDELIIVDDGSTDGTADAIRKLMKDSDRIRPVHQENGGCAAARNRGAEESCKDAVAFCDADDTWLPQHLRVLRSGMVRHGIPLVVSATTSVFPDGHEEAATIAEDRLLRFARRVEEETFLFEDGALEGYLRLAFGNTSDGMLIRRTLYEALGGFPAEHRLIEDIRFAFPVYSENAVLYINKALSRYYILEGSLCRADRVAAHENVIEALLNFKRTCRPLNAGERAALRQRIREAFLGLALALWRSGRGWLKAAARSLLYGVTAGQLRMIGAMLLTSRKKEETESA